MCGRYRLSRRKQLVEEYFDAPGDGDWSPRYNIAPTQPVPVIRQHPEEPRRVFSLMHWGLAPSWAKEKMMEMHRQEMAAMKADIETLKSSLAQMKANILTIRDPNELARWKNNVEMWETVVNHMDRMQKQMESMGTGMMHGPGMMMHDEDLRGGQTASPPPDKKPQ